MNKIRISALTLIPVIGGWLILSPPESPPNEAALAQPAIYMEPDARQARQAQPGRLPGEHPIPPGIETASEPTAAVPARATGWASLLYPELNEILRTRDLPDTEAIVLLHPMLSAADPVIRLAALEALADMQHGARIPALIAALDDPSAQIRIAALEGLAAEENIVATGVIQAYLFDADREVRLAAIGALADLESALAIPALAGLLFDADPQIRLQAVNAMGDIGSGEALPYLLQASYDSKVEVRDNAATILNELNSPRPD